MCSSHFSASFLLFCCVLLWTHEAAPSGHRFLFPPTNCTIIPEDAPRPAAPLPYREEELCNGFQMGLCRHIHPPHLLFESSRFLAVRSSRQTRLKDAAGRERAGGFNGEIYGQVLMSKRAAAHLAWSALRSLDTAELSGMKSKLQLLIGCTFIFAITRCSSCCQVHVRRRPTCREWIWKHGQCFNDQEGLNTHACSFTDLRTLINIMHLPTLNLTITNALMCKCALTWSLKPRLNTEAGIWRCENHTKWNQQ